MPINTRIAGSPTSIRSTATWLRSRLQTGVHDCGSQVYKARTDAEGGWQGHASSGFQTKMGDGGKVIDGLHSDVGTLSQSFDQYADGLHTAQAGMQRARDIALRGGLTVNGDTIEDPGSAPTAPQSLPTDGSTTPQQVRQYNSAMQAVQDHQLKVAAFNQAKDEADRANGVVDNATRVAEKVWEDLSGKKYIHATEFTNGFGGHLIKIQKNTLKAEAESLRSDAAKFEDNYLNSPGGSDQAKLNEELRFNNMMKASAVDGEVSDLARIGGKVPVVGLAISAAGVGWDIAHGKPAGKAIFSGALGTAAAFGAEAGVASMVEGAGAIVAAATPIGAAIMVGVGVGVLADYAWDHWVPGDVKNKIDDGLKVAGHAVVSVAKSAGHDIASAAKSVGNFLGSIF
ncbi:MAG TPA: hypothetical protein VEO01_30375 [Pseudonocardiaceae bacterium]|nr:hypothetical protein [Pseudonocardiaceae bacterium]